MPELSKTGVFFDSKAQKVVDSPPEEGVQLVAPGGEVTADVQAEIDRYKDLENGVVSEPETVTTASVSKKSRS